MRLAERRGLLTGRRLSPVADICAQYLLLADTRESTDTYVRNFKARMVAAHPEKMQELFPEYFRDAKAKGEAAFEDAYDESGEFDVDRVDDSLVEWRAPVGEEEHEAVERLLREAMEKAGGTITARELYGGG